MNAKQRLLDFASHHDLGHIEWSDVVAQVPSPSWWASDNVLIKGESERFGPVLAKVMSRHAWSWRNRYNNITAAKAAGDLGIAPKVYATDPETGIVLTELLANGWRVARLDYYADPDFRARLRKARADFAELEIELTQRSPLIDVLHLLDECEDRNITVDPRVLGMIERLKPFTDVLLEDRKDLTLLPSQGEATSSNIMVNQDGDIRLVGWGSAAKLSKVHDAALLLSEATPTVLDAQTLLTELLPDSSAKDRAVALVVAVLEHLRWALLTTLRSRTDPDDSLDSVKYGLWHMTLAEIAMNDTNWKTQVEEALA
ncbi:hypothetical protein [Aestuariimicrobium sp. Y1814]|uniref:hypothetical protein n=1 Tax=Aestuariimicrobium sp. Y1814 TaxID=3418742 RepID=UPI003DA7920E